MSKYYFLQGTHTVNPPTMQCSVFQSGQVSAMDCVQIAQRSHRLYITNVQSTHYAMQCGEHSLISTVAKSQQWVLLLR